MPVFLRLLRELRPYWKTLIIATILTFGTALIQLAPPLFQRAIIDHVLESSEVRALVHMVAGLIGVYLGRALIDSGDQYIRHALGQRFIYDLRLRLYNHLQRLSISFFENRQTGELMSRFTNDVRSLEMLVTHTAEYIIVDFLRLVGILALLFFLNWQLALLALLPLPILAVILRWFNARIRPIYRQIRQDMGMINAELAENLAGIQVIQAYCQEDQESRHFEEESRKYLKNSIRAIAQWTTVFPGVHFLAATGGTLVLGMGAWMVIDGRLSVGTLVAFISYSAMFLEPVRRLVEIDNSVQEAIASGERIYELLDSEPAIVETPDAMELDTVRGEICFDNVSFSYACSDVILHQVSFHVVPGETVALVGHSGAGKTSIANLIARFHDPSSGRVTLDGIDLRSIAIKSLRRHVVIVLQDTFLFNGTVRQNLLYSRPEATEEEMIEAARVAFAHDFIIGLPQGYETEVGERGVKLSGGQKQRLALARAIVTDPRIIILDEATSSVDADAEFAIQRALQEVLKGRTAIIIAHRLSTIRNADKIIALEEGRIVEIGQHATLMEREGVYSRLYQRQDQIPT